MEFPDTPLGRMAREIDTALDFGDLASCGAVQYGEPQNYHDHAYRFRFEIDGRAMEITLLDQGEPGWPARIPGTPEHERWRADLAATREERIAHLDAAARAMVQRGLRRGGQT